MLSSYPPVHFVGFPPGHMTHSEDWDISPVSGLIAECFLLTRRIGLFCTSVVLMHSLPGIACVHNLSQYCPADSAGAAITIRKG